MKTMPSFSGTTQHHTIRYGYFAFLIVALLLLPSLGHAQAMGDYCQFPPYVSVAPSPNIMLLVDVSGSMKESAYQQASDRQLFCSGNPNIECDPHHTDDCVRNWGTCTGSGHDRHCSGNTHKECHRDSDCTRSWGTCTSSSTTLYYGTCIGNDTKGCNLAPLSTSSGDCFTTGSCKCSSAEGACEATDTYEGYFDPNKNYSAGFCSNDPTLGCDSDRDCGSGNTCNYFAGYCSSDGLVCQTSSDCSGSQTCRPTYRETVATGVSCSVLYTYVCNNSNDPSSRQCPNRTMTQPADALNTCSKWYCTPKGAPTLITGDCGSPLSGNWLNFANMSRLDLLRWTMTGGSPASCASSNSGTNTGYAFCDPRVYQTQAGGNKVGDFCKDNLQLNVSGTVTGHGCILKTTGISGSSDTTVSVAIPWTGRIEDGLAFQFDNLPVKPRMGAYFFADNGVKSNYVYIGDFTQAASRSSYNYQNLITEVNATNTGGYTPTGPATWDTFNYFKQTRPSYGGIDASNNSDWKSPMFDCPTQGGANCNYVPCAKNFVLLLSDGLWNRPTCYNTDTGSDPVIPAYQMHMGYTCTLGSVSTTDDVNTSVSAVYSVGMFVGADGARALENVAMYGSFDTSAGYVDGSGNHWPGGTTGYPNSSCTPAGSSSGCTGGSQGSVCTNLPSPSAATRDWDKNGDGVPDTYYVADDALAMRTSIMNAVLSMLSRVSSGTAASVLASGEGSGANLIQAVFYPRLETGAGSIMWTGSLQNYWYYIDPYFANNTIREETTVDNKLNLTNDRIIQFFFDANSSPPKTRARLYTDSNGDGVPDSTTPSATADLDSVTNLWEAGSLLRDRNLSSSPRTIYVNTTAYNSSDNSAQNNAQVVFNSTNVSRTLLNVSTDAEAASVVDWIKGFDNSDAANFRSRTTTGSITADGTNVWKLGDIVDSTARIASWVPLNVYNKAYNDATYTAYTETSGYGARGMVFVGANDGMLHAFKLGKLEFPNHAGNTCTFTPAHCSNNASQTCNVDGECGTGNTCLPGDLACLANPGSDRGQEAWAFIPKNVIPYLTYLRSPDYCHLYTVDLTPFVFDASFDRPSGCTTTDSADCTKTVDSWRTVLIGGMRTGGACRNLGATCTDCVKTPVDGAGYSSYFALDVTDTLANPSAAPKLLWEYSSADLGFATTGAQVIRVGDKTKNGHWYVVFGSGPTGPVGGQPDYKFLARSDQNLKLFVLDLATGNLLRTMTMDGVGTPSVPYAFAGTITGGGIDSNLNYSDDAFYVGYVKRAGSSGSYTWTDGGVLRVLTRETTPSSWEVSTLVDGTGPITTSIAKLVNTRTNQLWVYFGAGRYYYLGDDPGPTSITDAAIRKLYGVRDPWYSSSGFCTSSCPSMGSLTDATTDSALTTADVPAGWYINLDPAQSTSTGYYAERVVSNPTATLAGVVFFSTYKPGKDTCSVGGKPYFWAVKYDTGGAAGTLLRGKALIQISTGAIEQINLSTAFNMGDTTANRGGRKADVQLAAGDTAGPGGMPGAESPPMFSTHQPVKRILHMRER